MRVLVVGLNPSRKHGKSSTLKTLYKWLDHLGLESVSFTNLYEDYQINVKDKKIDFIRSISSEYSKILALGNEVSRSLSSVGIIHFKLPHPSGLNRKLNDQVLMYGILEDCKQYLYGFMGSK